MVKALRTSFLTGVLLAAASITTAPFAAAWAADEFGARFSHQAPAALGVSESDALLATQDVDDVISAEDLNAIAPAAGDVSGAISGHGAVDRSVKEQRVNKTDSGPFSKDNNDSTTETPVE